MTFRPIQKIKNVKQKFFLQAKELEWAHVYHDSIRGISWLENLPLNVGRWACGYPLLYVLHRILSDYRPSSIIEFGLGESSKFISTYLEQELTNSTHVIVEQSTEWREAFKARFKLSDRTEILICESAQEKVNGHLSNRYTGLAGHTVKKHDLYLIDGPIGTPRYSRYDMVQCIKNFEQGDEFIMIVDDFERAGEKESVKDLLALLNQKGIKVHQGVYPGSSVALVIATEKYRYATSL